MDAGSCRRLRRAARAASFTFGWGSPHAILQEPLGHWHCGSCPQTSGPRLPRADTTCAGYQPEDLQATTVHTRYCSCQGRSQGTSLVGCIACSWLLARPGSLSPAPSSRRLSSPAGSAGPHAGPCLLEQVSQGQEYGLSQRDLWVAQEARRADRIHRSQPGVHG